MTKSPYYVEKDCLAIDALKMIREKDINSLPVLDGGSVVGSITWQVIVNVGIVL